MTFTTKTLLFACVCLLESSCYFACLDFHSSRCGMLGMSLRAQTTVEV